MYIKKGGFRRPRRSFTEVAFGLAFVIAVKPLILHWLNVIIMSVKLLIVGGFFALKTVDLIKVISGAGGVHVFSGDRELHNRGYING